VEAADDEREWQDDRLPAEIRTLVLSAREHQLPQG
jgi:hypothetical protein